jgi:hypothetical protein
LGAKVSGEEPCAIVIGGRRVVVIADENIPRDRGPVFVDWSRRKFTPSQTATVAEPWSTRVGWNGYI